MTDKHIFNYDFTLLQIFTLQHDLLESLWFLFSVKTNKSQERTTMVVKIRTRLAWSYNLTILLSQNNSNHNRIVYFSRFYVKLVGSCRVSRIEPILNNPTKNLNCFELALKKKIQSTQWIETTQYVLYYKINFYKRK